MALTEYTTPACTVCRKTTVVMLPIEKLVKWQKGHLIQNVFPTMSPDDRELIKTGIHPECWATMFPDEDQ